jgi:hypothetical protein
MNQQGEKGAVCTDGTSAVAAGEGKSFNTFLIVADAVFTDITSTLIEDVSVLEGPTFTKDQVYILPGVTSFKLASGEVMAYYTA